MASSSRYWHLAEYARQTMVELADEAASIYNMLEQDDDVGSLAKALDNLAYRLRTLANEVGGPVETLAGIDELLDKLEDHKV